MSEANEVDGVVKRDFYVCTCCKIKFGIEEMEKAECQKCGEDYGHFFTKIIRCGTFALAIWLEHEDGEITNYV